MLCNGSPSFSITFPGKKSLSLKHRPIFKIPFSDKMPLLIRPRINLKFSLVNTLEYRLRSALELIMMHFRGSLIEMTHYGVNTPPLASLKSPKVHPGVNFVMPISFRQFNFSSISFASRRFLPWLMSTLTIGSFFWIYLRRIVPTLTNLLKIGLETSSAFSIC